MNVKCNKMRDAEAGSAAEPAGHGWIFAAELAAAEEIELFEIDFGIFAFDPLPGWKAPLWRISDGFIELLRPEGRWRCHLPVGASSFLLLEHGAEGWMSRRGIRIDARRAADSRWRDQNGVPQSPRILSEMAAPPEELEGRAHALGEMARWELMEDGSALGWLDDSFERGPFSCRRDGDYLVVSNGSKKIAYAIGAQHWSWPMLERGLLRLMTGKGGGWEPEQLYRPIVF